MTDPAREQTRTPSADRPHMPGYGISPPDEGGGLLPWDWARERLIRARDYWIISVREDGRPHAMPVWGLWMDDCLYFSTGKESRKARNLRRDGRCVIHPDGGEESVVVEGVAETFQDAGTLARFFTAYKEKYDWDMSGSTDPFWVVRPTVAFGIIEHADQFATTATRWRF